MIVINNLANKIAFDKILVVVMEYYHSQSFMLLVQHFTW